jgi:hypothetical protein
LGKTFGPNLYLAKSVYATNQWVGSVAALPGSRSCVNNNLVTGFQTRLSVKPLSLDQLEKSVVAEHSITDGHQIDFNNVPVLDRASRYVDRLVKEAIQIRLNQNNFNRDNGFTLS